MTGDDIKKLVIVKMDEHTPYGPLSGQPSLLAGGDSLEQVKPVESYIDQCLAEAANEMLYVVPIYIAGYKTARVTATPDEEDNRIGTIIMPSDFLRLHSLRMNGWIDAIHRAYPVDHPVNKLQCMVWTRGTKQKPVAILKGIAHEDNSEKAELAYYSVDASDTHEIKEFKYIPRFANGNEYGNVVAEVIALNCAKKVYEIYGNTEQASVMANEINSVLNNLQQ